MFFSEKRSVNVANVYPDMIQTWNTYYLNVYTVSSWVCAHICMWLNWDHTGWRVFVWKNPFIKVPTQSICKSKPFANICSTHSYFMKHGIPFIDNSKVSWRCTLTFTFILLLLLRLPLKCKYFCMARIPPLCACVVGGSTFVCLSSSG